MQEKILRLRAILGISRELFARRLKVSLQTVYRWEKGQAEPMGLYAEKLERMFKKYLIENAQEEA